MFVLFFELLFLELAIDYFKVVGLEHGFFVVEIGYVPEEIHLEVVADLGLEAIVFRGIPS